jgi:hypothetical protein
MAAPYYDNVQWPTQDGLRVPTERAFFKATATQSEPTLDTYGELDLGTVAGGTVTLNLQQAGSSLITMNPTAAVTLVYPACWPGFSAQIQNLNSTTGNTITVEVAGNTTNTAVIPISKMATITHTGTNGGVYLSTAGN